MANSGVEFFDKLKQEAGALWDKAEAIADGLEYSGYLTLPPGGGDVVVGYNWGVMNSRQYSLGYVPVIRLVEYQPKNGPMQEAIGYLAENAAAQARVVGNFVGVARDSVGSSPDDVRKMAESAAKKNRKDAYNSMYSGRFTGNTYSFPYFDPYNHTISNTWKEASFTGGDAGIEGGVVAKLEGGIKMLASGLGNSYGTITKRQMYDGSSPGSYTTVFQLFNTLSDDSPSTILKNLNLVRVLTHNNLADKTTAVTYVPPCIYEVSIPGVRYAPAAYISNLVIENIGQVNRVSLMLDDASKLEVNVPDAWQISLTLTELLAESRNIYESVFNLESRVRVITTETIGVDS